MNTRPRMEAKGKSNGEQALDDFMAKKAEITQCWHVSRR